MKQNLCGLNRPLHERYDAKCSQNKLYDESLFILLALPTLSQFKISFKPIVDKNVIMCYLKTSLALTYRLLSGSYPAFVPIGP
jgi:hypothetical protein